MIIHKKDETTLFIDAEQDEMQELSEHFTFYVPGYKFMPAFRNRMWDGKIRLFDKRTQSLPFGLISKLGDFCKRYGHKFELTDEIKHSRNPAFNIKDLLYDIKLNKKYELRDYQEAGVISALRNKRSILVSPTGSGKSLMIYLMMRHNLLLDQDTLIIVPTTSLVEQLHGDFIEYSEGDDEFDTDSEVHRIYSGKDKNTDHKVIITTWQSAVKQGYNWFKRFKMVVGDEAHTFKAKSLTKIMGMLTEADYRIGTTGTLDDTQVHELVLEGCFGTPFKVTTTKDLIENQTLAELDIQCLVLKYSDADRKAFGKKTYQEEIDYIVTDAKRSKFTINLANSQKGNTLVLFNLVGKHGKPLYEALKKKVKKGRKVFFVSGEIKTSEREAIRAITENETDAIIVASMGTFSTGINIKNLHNIIFTAPTKSQIRVLQSIGRGLRKADNGQSTVVYDIADDLSWKKRENYTLKHAKGRISIYRKEQLKFNFHQINL